MLLNRISRRRRQLYSPLLVPCNSFFTTLCLLLLLFLYPPEVSPAVASSDAAALLAFKSRADLHSRLPYNHSNYCRWIGVQCSKARVTRLVIEGFNLGGVFAGDSLSRLDQLRVLSLQNNSLTGPIPDLSPLLNLKTLFLDHNAFSGTFPPSIFSLHRIKTIDLSSNRLAGPLPSPLTKLDRLNYLRVDSNFFNGTVPAFNQSSLQTFNVSGNNLTGAIPVTAVLSRFGVESYLENPGLCGEILHKECLPGPPFFHSSAPPPQLAADLHGMSADAHPKQTKIRKIKTPLVIGFSCGVLLIFTGLILCLAASALRKDKPEKGAATEDDAEAARAAAIRQIELENELEAKVKRMQVGRSGSLAFCGGEAQIYTVEQLMRAAAELLGRGTVGTTYKAVLDNNLIVTVKRLDAAKIAAGMSKEGFQQHMEAVGGLRHPNLVPLRAYLQAKEERILVYDYHANGSLFSLIHGSKSSRAKPLHWTSCLKMAEDVCQGLSYIHQAWHLTHGNLKSSNVLLGPDFEACISDYCLTPLFSNNPQETTPKSDVYSFGVLLLELLTSKPPSEHPETKVNVRETMNWVRSMRGVGEDEDDDDKLVMLLGVAFGCRLQNPDERPTMWQVLKMLQEIKEDHQGNVHMEDDHDGS